MIIYQQILAKLAAAGYSSYRLSAENLISGSCMDRIRRGKPITTKTIDTICELCNCQPGDLLRFEPNEIKEGK